ncbi:MAG: ComEC/Rec2 family competence protein [Prevotella sp.]|nr:ComEC/Rec2 family competence protein [Prevotella sp.]
MGSNFHERMPLVRLAICLMVGIVVGEQLTGQVYWWLVLAGLVICTLLLWRYEYWQSAGIALCFVALGITLITRQPDTSPYGKSETHQLSRVERTRQRCLQWRQKLLERYEAQGLEGEQYAVVAAMTLGDKSALTKHVREVYSVTGASHVLALSGLHLGIIYTLLSFLVVGKRWQTLSQIICILGIWAFAFLVGLSASVVRSAIMLTVYALLSLGHRDKMSLNTLAFTAILMLIVNPRSLFDIGFQLSFMAVGAILLWLPVFMSVFSESYLMDHRLVKWVWGMIGVSLSAQLGVAPLIAYYFGRFSTYFLLSNFIVVPAATFILYLSLPALLIPGFAYLLIYIVKQLNTCLFYLAAIPGASIEGLHPTKIQTTMIYVIIVAVYLLLLRLKPLLHVT